MDMSMKMGVSSLHTRSKGGELPAWASRSDLWSDFTRTDRLGVTDTHAATIYVKDTNGVWIPKAANVLTRTDLGLQTVPTRTNLLTYSQEFNNAAWSKRTGYSVVANTAIAPDGTMTADQIVNVSNSAPGEGLRQQGGANVKYTFSIWAKADTAASIQLSLKNNNSDTVVAETSATLTTSWQRISVTATPNGGTPGFRAEFGTDGAFGSIYVWQAQIEAGGFASPPILTTTTSVTVNGNQQVISGLGTQLATGVAGLVQVDLLGLTSGAWCLTFNNGTINNYAVIRNDGSAPPTSIIMQTVIGGVSQGIVSCKSVSAGVKTIAFISTENYQVVRVVGSSAPTPDTSVSWPVVDRIGIGGAGYSTGLNQYQFTRKLALDFLAPGDDPATKFAEWYAKAELAAAA